jgi:catalase
MQAAIREGGFVSFPEIQSGEKIRKRSDSFSDHYTQATLFWNSMSEHERRHIVMAFQVELGKVQHSHIQEKMVDHLNHINHTLAVAVANTLGLTPPKTDESKKYKKSSPALSQENHQVTGRKGRKVALLGAEGNCVSEMKDLQNVLNTAGVTPLVISKHLGTLEGELEVDLNYRGSVSVLFDGVIVGGIHESTKNDAIHFIQEAYRHLKPIGAFGEGVKLLEAAGIKATKPAGSSKTSTTAGVVVAGSAVNVAAFWTEFQLALEKYRFWEREEPIGWGF